MKPIRICILAPQGRLTCPDKIEFSHVFALITPLRRSTCEINSNMTMFQNSKILNTS